MPCKGATTEATRRATTKKPKRTEGKRREEKRRLAEQKRERGGNKKRQTRVTTQRDKVAHSFTSFGVEMREAITIEKESHVA